MATMADLDEVALAMPQATKELSADGRPAYHVHGKLFCILRNRRPDAVDPETGERLVEMLMFRVADLDVKELMLGDDRGIYFTTPHSNGYPAVLLRISKTDQPLAPDASVRTRAAGSSSAPAFATYRRLRRYGR
jgi:hypothetical protein